MSFSKAQKNLHEQIDYNPPPGYYELPYHNKMSFGQTTFGKQERFERDIIDQGPGPGSYNNDRRQKIKKSKDILISGILDEAKKNETIQGGSDSEIKISSIPSIPKKSATRVYEQLAPGILILHEEENENSNVGPGSYNAKYESKFKKSVAHKINPQHKKKRQPVDQPQVKIPTIAEEIRNQKRLLYKKNLIKSSGINRSMISPSDLCLEVIILRQKLLRSDQGPPPGYYYNEKYQSSFKPLDNDFPTEYQLLMGKQERFKENDETQPVGPGTYEAPHHPEQNGGFIAREERKLHKKNINPGPGTYKVEPVSKLPTDAKGNYPPIFGSGCNRFYSADSKFTSTPGPGSYKLDGPKKKKVKYLKIKKDFYDSQFSKSTKPDQQIGDELFGKSGNKSGSAEFLTEYPIRQKKQKNTHNFSSKVDRFSHEKGHKVQIGPGNYDPVNQSFKKQTYNKNQHGYVGSKQARFDDPIVRPNLGPGSYQNNLDLIREKKYINIKM